MKRKEIKKMKLDMEVLPYAQRLDYWDKNGLEFSTRTIQYEDKLGNLTELSISPDENNEREIYLYTKFLFTHYQSSGQWKCNLEKMISDYFSQVDNDANEKELIKQSIDEIDRRYLNSKSDKDLETRMYSIGFDASIKGTWELFFDNKIYDFMLNFCQGIADEKFKRFLNNRLLALDSGKTVVEEDNSMNKINGWNIKKRYYLFELLGFTPSKILKQYSIEDQQKLLGILFNVAIDTAKKVKNGSHPRYKLNGADKLEVDLFLSSLKNIEKG